jgi:hypothetical protein
MLANRGADALNESPGSVDRTTELACEVDILIGNIVRLWNSSDFTGTCVRISEQPNLQVQIYEFQIYKFREYMFNFNL